MKPATELPWSQKAMDTFWDKVDKSGGPDACWLWKRSTMVAGYGQVNMGTHSKSLRAHRVAYELTHGRLPKGEYGKHGVCILHSCDNRLCCNPKHLRAGTQRENVQDAHRKGRLKTWVANDAETKRKVDAYPKLVEALQHVLILAKASGSPEYPAYRDAAVLLRELGEEA